MPALVALTPVHLDAVLAFERENRAWFARSLTDPGDRYHAALADHLRAQLDEQTAGGCALYGLLDAGGAVLGRFNLWQLRGGAADVGYRVAERASGRGVATETLHELCRRAVSDHGLLRLDAATGVANVASQRVLLKAGFRATGGCIVAGRPGLGFTRRLTAPEVVPAAP